MFTTGRRGRTLALLVVLLFGMGATPAASAGSAVPHVADARAGGSGAAGTFGAFHEPGKPDVPDPVTFLPMTPASHRANRPEAALGFGSRGEPATAAVPRPPKATLSAATDTVASPAPPLVAGASVAPVRPPKSASGAIRAGIGSIGGAGSNAVATGSIHGTIKDTLGEWIGLGSVQATGLVTPPTSSIAYGSYWFDLPPDDYALLVQDLYGNHVNGYWCGGPHLCSDIGAATRISLAPGASIQLDIVMDLLPTISGTIFGSDGSPLSGAVIGIDSIWGASATQPDGTFSVPVQPGAHKLFAAPASSVPGGFFVSTGTNHWTQRMADGTELVTSAGLNVSGLTMTLPAYRTVSGINTDTGNQPVGHSSALLWQGSDSVAWTWIGEDGSFAFQAPTGGSYTLEAEAGCPHATVWYKATAPGYSGTQAGASVISIGNQDINGLVIKHPACPTVQGTITTHTGAPAAGGWVTLSRADGMTGGGSGPIAANGTYAVELQPGTYVLQASDAAGDDAPGYYTPGGWVASAAQATQLAVGVGGLSGINLQLPAFRHVSGTITDPDGNPVQGVEVLPHWGGSAYTGADGRYSVKLAPGAFTISYGSTYRTRPGYHGAAGYVAAQSDALPVSTVAGDVTGVDAVVPWWPRVTGTITGSSGGPLQGISVGVHEPGSTWEFATATTAPDGTYTLYIPGAYAGTYVVRAGVPEVYEEKTSNVILGSGDIAGIDFLLRGFPAVTGTVTDSSGAPIPNIDVSVSNGATWRVSRTGVDGHYRVVLPLGPTLENLSVSFHDPYELHVFGYLGEGGFSNTAISFSLGVDQVRVADVVMPTYRFLTGVVRDPEGAPVRDAVLSSYREPAFWDPEASDWTWTDGAYSLKLAPGGHYIAVGAPDDLVSGWFGDGGFNYAASTAGTFTMPDHDVTSDIELPPALHVSGRLTSSSKPVDSIEVDILLNGAAYAHTSTNDEGEWSVTVAPGAYTVGVYDPGHVFSHGWIGASGFTLDPDVARIVQVSTEDVAGVNVSLKRDVSIKGTVKDTAGKPHAYVYTEVWVNGTYYAQTWTSSKGTYSLRVPTGTTAQLWMYDANLKLAPGWRTSTSITANPARAAVTRIGTAGVSGLNFVAPAPRFISGTVKAVNAAGTTVMLKKAFVGAYAYGSAASLAIAGTGGKFKVPVLPGTYTVWSDVTGLVEGRPAAYAGGWYRSSGITTQWSQATKITPPSGGTSISIRLARPAHITGYLLDPVDLRIEGTVVVFADGSAYDAVSTSNGFFAITVPSGTYRVAAYDPYGIHLGGWYAEGSGYAETFAEASDVAVAAFDAVYIGIELPLDGPPDPPTSVVAVPFHESARVTFVPPATPVYRPIIHSVVTASPGGRRCTTTSTSCLVTGLVDGTPYTFTVTTSTNMGPSDPSTPSAPITPLPVPGAPTSVSADPSGLAPTVSWQNPPDNGSALTGAVVTASPGGLTCAAPAGATSCQFQPLAEGWYTFSVAASNALGWGPVSTATQPVPADATAPVVGAPEVVLRAGASMTTAAVPVTATWSATDAVSGVAASTLELASGDAWAPVTLASPAATRWAGAVDAGASSLQLRAGATDVLGNTALPVTGPALRVLVMEESGAGTSVSGSWTTKASSSASGGKTRVTTTKGASFTFKFTGRAVAWVSRRSWSNGKVAVYVDGKRVATVSVYAEPANRWVAWTKSWPTSGSHTVKIVNLDDGWRVDVDAFEILR